jgi:hypothetical protein
LSLLCAIIFHFLKQKIMGAFLHIGFIAKATAELPTGCTIKQVNEALKDFYSADTFDCKVSNGEVTWTLKPKVVKAELAKFVETFYEDYHGGTDNRRVRRSLDFIREFEVTSDWLEQAEAEGHEYFSVSDYGCEESFTVLDRHEISIDTTTITLGSEGKFSMEEDECTLRFLETSAQKAFSNFKLGKTIRAFVF